MKSKVFNLIMIAVSVVGNGVTWLVAFLGFPKESPAAILHYSASVGVDFIGESSQIYVLPAIGLAVASGNTILGLALQRTSKRASHILWGAGVGVQLILIIALTILWQLNR